MQTKFNSFHPTLPPFDKIFTERHCQGYGNAAINILREGKKIISAGTVENTGGETVPKAFGIRPRRIRGKFLRSPE
jgi:hypothetical protein